MTSPFPVSPAAFAGRTGRGVRVAVVDSGIHASHPHVGGIAGGVAFDSEGRRHDDVVDRMGHGTAVAAAIREKAPDVSLLAVKVFDRTLVATGLALVEGIRWAAIERVQLINLSLGTTNPEHAPALEAAVAFATEHGAIVVAAAPQDGTVWLPGAIAGVVAVEVDWTCPRDACGGSIIAQDTLRLRASGYPRPIPGVSPERNLKGQSFAVANVTGLLALALEGAPVGSIRELAARLP